MEKADIKKAAAVIAQVLGETKQHALQKIERLIEHCGIDLVQTTVEETQQVEADGGLMTNNGKRRRTTGGVFFYLIKQKLSPEQLAVTLPPTDWKKINADKKRRKQAEREKAEDTK